MTQSSLHLPLIPDIGTRPTEDIVRTLRSRGVRADIGCVNWADSYPHAPESYAMLAYDGRSIFVLFAIRPTELRAVATEDLQPVASDTCFEIFLKKAGDTHYCNFEFNYRGITNVSRRPGRAGAVKFTPDKLARILRYPLAAAPLPHESRPADPADEVALLTVIPLSLIAVDSSDRFPLLLEGNIYSCSDGSNAPYFLSWAPVSTPAPDFHRPDFFAPIILDDNE
ncbi:MAG: hypothetical protein K2I64_00300 [Muribaculaceae bacterium]|nr:hypothetical protein [Muribaculaceae bacterium]